jgi:large subunit ribosomal protein L25
VLRDIKIQGQPRTQAGRRVSRKLARQGLLPGIVYGGDQPAEMFQVEARQVERIAHTLGGGLTTLFHFSVAGQSKPSVVIIKELQEDPVTGHLLHADLMRISMERSLHLKVPLRIVGTAKGVKQQGGVLDHILREIEISCLPADIPEAVEVEVTELEMGHSLKVEDLTIPENVKVLTDLHSPVVSILAPAAEKSHAAEAEVEAPAEEAEEPEVIGKGKAEEDEGAAKTEKSE